MLLEEAAPASPPALENNQVAGALARLSELVQGYGDAGADDVQFLVGRAPRIRIDGKLLHEDNEAAQGGVPESEMLMWAEGLANREGREALESGEKGHLWTAGEAGKYRMRVTFRRQLGGYAAAVRIIPTTVPSVQDVAAPSQVLELLNSHGGLIVVCGATASGKTWLLGSFVDEINNHHEKHVYTVEDPIEIVHPTKKSLISQREVGSHVSSYAEGMRAALRSSPDVILVGELLDRETTQQAVEAAGKGHLVLTTAHASSAVDALNFLVSQFPTNEQASARTRLAQSHEANHVQRLVPKKEGRGRVPAREILLNTRAVANNIRDGQFQMLVSRLVARENMTTLEDDLIRLAESNVISWESAIEFANDRAPVEDRAAFFAEKVSA